MKSVIPSLAFDREAEEAAEFYVSVFSVERGLSWAEHAFSQSR